MDVQLWRRCNAPLIANEAAPVMKSAAGRHSAGGASERPEIAGNGELEDLRWWPLADLPRLPIVDVTEFVLTEALRRWQQRLPIGSEPPRLFCYRGDCARWRVPGRGSWNPPPARVFGTA